ncbi:MAG: class I SAM-dependent methyltransferase [Planctomycetaceae bacterium]
MKAYPEFFEGGAEEELKVSLEFLQSDEMALISQTSFLERLGLLGLASAFKPQRLLEVGRSRGGSTILLSFAVAESGGKMVSVDPNNPVCEHFINRNLRSKLEKRGVCFLDGMSPEVIGQASQLVNGLFDFVFIDADHSYDAVVADLLGVLPYVEENGYIVMHDANYAGVWDAVQRVVSDTGITDCGLFCRDANRNYTHLQSRGRPAVWGGLHLLRVTRSNWVRRLCLRWFR